MSCTIANSTHIKACPTYRVGVINNTNNSWMMTSKLIFCFNDDDVDRHKSVLKAINDRHYIGQMCLNDDAKTVTTTNNNIITIY